MPTYLVGRFRVTDPEVYRRYAELSAPLVKKFGGTFIVRGGACTVVEGDAAEGRTVIAEFSSADAAEAFYRSREYQAIVGIRQMAATGSLAIVDGLSQENRDNPPGNVAGQAGG